LGRPSCQALDLGHSTQGWTLKALEVKGTTLTLPQSVLLWKIEPLIKIGRLTRSEHPIQLIADERPDVVLESALLSAISRDVGSCPSRPTSPHLVVTHCALPFLALPFLVLPCLALLGPSLPSPALPCPAGYCHKPSTWKCTCWLHATARPPLYHHPPWPA